VTVIPEPDIRGWLAVTLGNGSGSPTLCGPVRYMQVAGRHRVRENSTRRKPSRGCNGPSTRTLPPQASQPTPGSPLRRPAHHRRLRFCQPFGARRALAKAWMMAGPGRCTPQSRTRRAAPIPWWRVASGRLRAVLLLTVRGACTLARQGTPLKVVLEARFGGRWGGLRLTGGVALSVEGGWCLGWPSWLCEVAPAGGHVALVVGWCLVGLPCAP